jgi:hypothetical protein
MHARAFASLIAVVLLSGCGSRSVLDGDFTSAADAGVDVDSGPPPIPKECGDGKCGAGETCTSCPLDCGFCATCGDGKCDATETCSSCPQDCGVCPTCGNGFCESSENCQTCAPDCGACPSCGDGKCEAQKAETCYSCPKDCGSCDGCGDGICKNNETCASCPMDCGVCSVCGNNKCEQYETCANCTQDCGQCTTLSCFQAFTCALKCANLQTNPPQVSLSCVANCLALGCPDTQFFFDQAFNCAVFKGLPKCGGNFMCLQQECDAEIAACLGATCQ